MLMLTETWCTASAKTQNRRQDKTEKRENGVECSVVSVYLLRVQHMALQGGLSKRIMRDV